MSAETAARRSVVGWFVRAAATGLALLYAVPAIWYLRGRGKRVGPDDLEDAIDLGPLDAFVDGRPVRVAVPNRGTDAWSEGVGTSGSVFVLRRGAEVSALDSVCPHTGCSVSVDDQSGGFRCPCHQSAFAADGSWLRGPAPRGLDAQAVRVVDGRVKLRYVRYRAGRSDRVPG